MSAAPPSNLGSPDSPNREPTPADAGVQPEVQPENNPENVLTADDTEEEEDQSVDGRSLAPSTESLRPSLFDYRQENGRTYHRYKDGKYIFPNDERESDRLDMEFQIWMISLDDRLGVAPPCLGSSKPTRVLDIGTGTGIWAMHFGDEHPEAEVIGTDLSPIQPGFVPPNVKFEIDDLEDEWTYSLPFDYIHSRVMTSSIGDWSVYLRKCYENLKPGGYVELQEIDLFATSDDGTLKPESALMRWCNLLMEASEKFGRPFVRGPTLKDIMTAAGFVDVSITVLKWPTNSWPKDPKYKEIGIWENANMLEGLEGFSMAALTRGHNWSRIEVEVFLAEVRKDFNDKSIHAYWPAYCIVGRKPETV
ncbi:Secondary metabolism regulator LAE1 [Colletotrichum sp. SAR 10_98]|nr:Secondary metabolism regulator LAE1 [Colletotrichum sp. SAR 10_98]